MMSDYSTGLNPYAPSEVASDPEAAALPTAPVGGVSTTAVCLWTIAACSAAGALFALSAVAVVIVALSLSGSGELTEIQEFGGLAIMAGVGVVTGGVLALITAIPVVLLLVASGMPVRKVGHRWIPVRKADRRWDGRGIRNFATVAGLLSGFLPLTVVSGFEISAVFVSIVPSVFGAIAARVLVFPLARKASDQAQPLPNDPAGNYAEPLTRPTTKLEP